MMNRLFVSVLIVGGAIFGIAGSAGAYPPAPVPPPQEAPPQAPATAVAAAPPSVAAPRALPATGSSGVELNLVVAGGLLVGGAALAMAGQRRRRLTAA
jgi:LPXTG-motif cell wall-anchored protein